MYKKRKWKKRILSVGLAAIMTLGGQVTVFVHSVIQMAIISEILRG